MKQIVTLIAILLFGYSASAQTIITDYTGASSATATLTTLVTPANYFSGTTGVWTAGVRATRRSGTIPTTYAILQGSVDGTNWVNYYGTSADTFTLSNTASAQTKIWPINGGRLLKARIYITAATGSDTVDYKAYFIKN